MNIEFDTIDESLVLRVGDIEGTDASLHVDFKFLEPIDVDRIKRALNHMFEHAQREIKLSAKVRKNDR